MTGLIARGQAGRIESVAVSPTKLVVTFEDGPGRLGAVKRS
jgi:hypothetical protein